MALSQGTTSTLGGLGGAAIGSFWGPLGASIGYTIGSLLGGLFGSTPNTVSEGPRLSNLQVTASTNSAPLAKVWGTMRLGCPMIWSTGLRETRHVEVKKYRTGLFSKSKQTIITYTYSASFAVAMCEGEITGVKKVWADGRLIADLSDTASVSDFATSMFNLTGNNRKGDADFSIYTGSETQTADPTIAAALGAANAPGYRGTAYLVFKNFQLEEYENRIPTITVEVVRNGSANTFARLTTTGNQLSGIASPTFFRIVDGTLQVSNSSRVSSTISKGGFTQICGLDGTHYATVPAREINSLLDESVSLCAGYLGADPVYVTGHSTGIIKIGASKTLTPNSFGGLAGRLNGFCVNQAATRLWVLYSVAPHAEADYRYTIYDQNLTQLSDEPFGSDLFDTAMNSATEGVPGYTNPWAIEDNGRWLWHVYFRSTPAGSFLRAYELQDDGSWAKRWDSYDNGGIGSLGGDNRGIVANNGMCWTVYGGQIRIATFTRVQQGTSTAPAISSVVSELCLETGLSAGDIDVTALTDTVDGFVRPGPMTARQAIQPLAQAYGFDAAEIGGKMVFTPRGGTSAASIADDELGAYEDGSEFAGPLQSTRAQETELPRRVQVTYMDTAADYQEGIQYAGRVVTQSDNLIQVELPIAMDADQAAQTADILLKDAWTGRTRYEFSTGIKYLYVTPTDIVTLTADGTQHKVFITSREVHIPGMVTFHGVAYDEANYSSSVTGAETAFNAQSISGVSATLLLPIDTSMLVDGDNNSGLYLAADGFAPGWTGAGALYSTDNSVWNTIGTLLSSDGATIGKATTALGSGDLYVIDDSTLNVKMMGGATLSSITETQLLEQNNLALVGQNGSWELVCFQTATLESDGTYTLSGFLRGLRGTGWAVGTHQTDDWFVYLGTAGTVERHLKDTSTIGATHYYAGAGFGTLLDEALVQTNTFACQSLKPYPPVSIKGARDGSGNLTIRWIRQGRVDNTWQDSKDVPLGETSEAYEVDIMNGSTVVRTITGLSSPTASYTAAEQVTDFGSAQAPVTVRVYQISAEVGRGNKGEASI